MVQTYDFDGIHIEEPGMRADSYASWEDVLAEHGYDLRIAPKVWDPDIGKWVTSETTYRDIRHEEAKNMVLFFKELREGLSSLGPNYEYPYFSIQSVHNYAPYNHDILGEGGAEGFVC